jgi:hypothetical protein
VDVLVRHAIALAVVKDEAVLASPFVLTNRAIKP